MCMSFNEAYDCGLCEDCAYDPSECYNCGECARDKAFCVASDYEPFEDD